MEHYEYSCSCVESYYCYNCNKFVDECFTNDLYDDIFVCPECSHKEVISVDKYVRDKVKKLHKEHKKELKELASSFKEEEEKLFKELFEDYYNVKLN